MTHYYALEAFLLQFAIKIHEHKQNQDHYQ
jgi:hypothetical protein